MDLMEGTKRSFDSNTAGERCPSFVAFCSRQYVVGGNADDCILLNSLAGAWRHHESVGSLTYSEWTLIPKRPAIEYSFPFTVVISGLVIELKWKP